MKKEHDYNPNCGNSWIGPFVALEIDRAISAGLNKDHRPHPGHFINLTDMIIAPLILEKVSSKILEHLKIDFVQPSDRITMDELLDPNLRQISEMLKSEFGAEVVRRLELSMEKDKVRTLPPY